MIIECSIHYDNIFYSNKVTNKSNNKNQDLILKRSEFVVRLLHEESEIKRILYRGDAPLPQQLEER